MGNEVSYATKKGAAVNPPPGWLRPSTFEEPEPGASFCNDPFSVFKPDMPCLQNLLQQGLLLFSEPVCT